MAVTSTNAQTLDATGRYVVGVGDLAVVADPAATIITHALGSCIGVTLYDPVRKVGGLLHFMLPTSSLNASKAAANPAMFADTGVPLLFRMSYELGARKEDLIVCAAGGAEILGDDQQFKIGTRNRTMLRKLFWKNNILIAAEDSGGSISRTLSIRLSDGAVTVRSKGTERVLWPE